MKKYLNKNYTINKLLVNKFTKSKFNLGFNVIKVVLKVKIFQILFLKLLKN